MNLQEKHYKLVHKGDSTISPDELTEQAAKITKDYMKRFAEWLDEKDALQSNNKWVLNDNRIIDSTDKLIEIFLETEK